jgi:hypothetical protein
MSILMSFPGNFQVGESADFPGRQFIAATGPWSSDATRYATENDVREVHLNVYAGWTDSGVEFLRELPQLDSLHIASGRAIDLRPLYDLPNIKLLGIAGEIKAAFSFTRLLRLEELRLEKWNAMKFASAFDCVGLKVLALSNYPGPDLSAMTRLVSLEQLRISLGKVESLKGLSALKKLRLLLVQESNNLESLAGMEDLAELEEIFVYRAKRLKYLGSMAGLERLTSVTLTAVPSIESLRSLEHCKALEQVVLLQNTTVADGDISFLKSLPKLRLVRFNEEPHYNAKLADFQASRG